MTWNKMVNELTTGHLEGSLLSSYALNSAYKRDAFFKKCRFLDKTSIATTNFL